jgi:hypothetical protein
MRLLEGNIDNQPTFSGKDSYTKYCINLQTQSPDWPWRNLPVSYTLNSQRYRSLEWKDCDWSNSILVFGCSMVYGVGVSDQDTLTSHLTNITGIPTINLGMGGAGLMFQLANSIILKEHNISPKAVVYVWPDRTRQTEFRTSNQVLHHGAWNLDNSWMKDLMINDVHNQHLSDYLIRNIRLLWNCPVIEASWYADMCESTGASKLHFMDYARDCAHPGPSTLKEAALVISKNLSKYY